MIEIEHEKNPGVFCIIYTITSTIMDNKRKMGEFSSIPGIVLREKFTGNPHLLYIYIDFKR